MRIDRPCRPRLHTHSYGFFALQVVECDRLFWAQSRQALDPWKQEALKIITVVMLRFGMTSGLNRPKQPEIVRAKLLAAGAELLSEGVPLSIGEVAAAAGVTKGAVQHHFGSRESLLAAIYDDLQLHLEQALESHRPGMSAAESYVAATVNAPLDRTTTMQWRALLVACVIERGLADRWGSWTRADRTSDGKESASQLIARLAADGLWLSDTLGTYALGKSERKELAQALHQLAKGKAE